MKIRCLLYGLMVTTPIGGTIAMPAAAQTPPTASPADPARAPATTPNPIPTQLDAVTTAAMRSRRTLDDVPSTVSVITTEIIDRENIMQNIRGIDGNRVHTHCAS